jgi:hypothetical protein
MPRVKINCNPELTSEVKLNGQCNNYILLGRVRDSKHGRVDVFLDADENFVALEVGKRGSGKSFGMGAILESFATEENECSIAKHGDNRRGVLLIDPLDIHWTAIYPVKKDVSPDMDFQHRLLKRWGGIKAEKVKVNVFIPAGTRRGEDPAEFVDFQLPVSELTPDDFAMLYGTNLVTEPAGMLLWELFEKVTRLGFNIGRRRIPPKGQYGLADLIDALQDEELQENFSSQTIRAVGQRLRTWHGDELFQSATGTPISQLVQSGELTILSLNRLSEDMRSVVTGVVVRKIKAERTPWSQFERRRAFDPDAKAPNGTPVPRTIVAIDEAQLLIPASGGGPARQAVESYILEGRNFGLSMWLATQRPKGAISQKAISQLDTLIAHRLSSGGDLGAVKDLIQVALPEKMRVNEREVGLEELIRSLDIGMALVSSDSATRTFVMDVRPRVVAHGGKAF